MNQYLPDLQPSKSCFVRLRLAKEYRHLSVIPLRLSLSLTLSKCRARFGVLFSRNGVTGSSGRDALGNIEAAWRQYGIVVVVITEEIVRQVVRGWDFYSVLEQLYEAARFSQRVGVDIAKTWT